MYRLKITATCDQTSGGYFFIVRKILSFVTRTEAMYPLSSKFNKKRISSILINSPPLRGEINRLWEALVAYSHTTKIFVRSQNILYITNYGGIFNVCLLTYKNRRTMPTVLSLCKFFSRNKIINRYIKII